jgi:hypothetical protein
MRKAMLGLKAYQLEDIARLSLVDGAILSWSTGLGKTLAMIAWALMKCGWTGKLEVNAPVLIVSSEDLHKQTAREALEKFGIRLEKFRGQSVGPGFYIVSYQMLANMGTAPDAFTCVMVDEGDKIKKTGSDSSQAVRRLKPRYRLIATATPLADRLRDLFWQCCWVCENDPREARRWPYQATAPEYARFAGRYQVTGENAAGAPERSPEISQLFRLWRLLGPIVLRRRLEDCGERIVGVSHQIVPCPLGWQQKAAYEQALFSPDLEIGVRLGALRRIAGGGGWPNPKLATALTIIADCVGRGEQVLVASDFRAPNDAIAARLRDARIPYVLMDGRTNPTGRADMAEAFKGGEIPVVMIGLKSGAEGHSYPRCNNLILLNYSWELKKLPQVIGRARRINSEKDLNVWSLVSQGTVENRMAQLILDEKNVAAELVLDGIWPTAELAMHSAAGWLDLAKRDYRLNLLTHNEQAIGERWHLLKERLQAALLVSLNRRFPLP